MPITENDIKLLASQRMTDTPDGGGRMTGNVVQSGVDNNIFDDVSNLDRVYGNVSLRKVFAAVLTNDTEKYMGSRVVIDQPPADPNVHCVMFAASSQFDNRTGASVKVESYLAPGPAYQGLLYGDHLAGMASVMLIQQTDRELPTIGQVLLLRKDSGLPGQVDQYVRITAVESTPNQRFTDGQGDFTRTVVTCTISDPLRAAFPGFPAIRIDAGLDFTGKTEVMESVVADASQYFGIRPLEVAAQAGDINLKCDSIFANLLPSAQLEIPFADVRTNGLNTSVVASGGPVTQSLTCTFTPSQAIFVGGAIAPSSLSLVRDGTSLTDKDGALLLGGSQVGFVDYATGVLSLQQDVFGAGGGTHNVTYTPATVATIVPKSVGIDVTAEGRAYTYIATLEPIPAPGTLIASYLSGGRWYVLRDGGSGAVLGSSPSLGAGTVNFTTGTLTLTLGALPDVGSAIVLQWAEASQAPAYDQSWLRYGMSGNSDPVLYAQIPGLPIPFDGTISWQESGVAKTVTVGPNSVVGDAYVTQDNAGTMLFAPKKLPQPGTVFNLSFNSYTDYTETAALPTGALTHTPIRAGSVRFSVEVEITYALVGSGLAAQFTNDNTQSTTRTRTFTLYPDDNGVLRSYDEWGSSFGTVNLTTGAVTLETSPIVVLGDRLGPYITHISSAGNTVWSTWNEFPAGNRSRTMSITSTTTQVYYSGQSGTPSTTTATPANWKLDFNLFSGRRLGGVNFKLGDEVFTQDGTVLRRDINPATGVGSAPVGQVGNSTIEVTAWQVGADNLLVDLAAGQVPSTDPVQNLFGSDTVVFRTAGAPLRVGSFSVVGALTNGTAFNVTADSDGLIDTAYLKGKIDYLTGVARLWGAYPTGYLGTFETANTAIDGFTPFNRSPINTASLRYNAVAYSYLPLDASILGLDPVRLPQDGRVPVFKAGRVVLVHNTQSLAPQTVSNGQTVNTGRTLLSRIRAWGADGLPITDGWAADLDAGTVTFSNVSGYSQPVTIEHRVEDEALCLESQITGDLRLSRTLTHDYPLGSYVSSSYVMGTLQAASQDSFGQEAWTNEWSDQTIGNPLLASYNDVANPIEVTNAGAITERWALVFQSDTTFNLVGEQVGQIISGSTAAVLAPVNPATGAPYFTLQPAGWGSGWAAGNVLRFNTVGAARPLWLARTVMQSPAAPPGTDQITISIMGDIDQ